MLFFSSMSKDMGFFPPGFFSFQVFGVGFFLPAAGAEEQNPIFFPVFSFEVPCPACFPS